MSNNPPGAESAAQCLTLGCLLAGGVRVTPAGNDGSVRVVRLLSDGDFTAEYVCGVREMPWVQAGDMG